MSWKKHFKSVQINADKIMNQRDISIQNQGGNASGSASKVASYLPEVYAGHPNRIQRYYQYEDMDRDSDISVDLNTIAEFCTQSEEQSDAPFFIKYNQDGNDTEIKLLKQCLDKWIKINNFRQRLFYIFRSVLVNGDAFFLRDPETMEWDWIDAFSVILVKVDQDKGKDPTEYLVKGLDYSKAAKYATQKTDSGLSTIGVSGSYSSRASGTSSGGSFQLAGSHVDARQHKPGGAPGTTQDATLIDAKHIVHLSLSVGMDVNWPFGKSALEPVYKVYKQKEMLEDSIIIYRVQRAPERRVFYIDVGDMPAIRAQAHLAKIKNEIHQRRIPNRNGGGNGSVVDGAYNPLAIMDDYYFAQTAGGRGSKVETLPGGSQMSELGDLDYFTAKFARGMQIPPSYLAISDEKSGVAYNDGKSGNALIQEFRFSKFCMRLQALIEPVFDKDFKKFVENSGVNVEEDLYELRFNPPQNFSKYRQMDLDTQQAQVYSQIASVKVIAERTKLMRYLGWTEEECLANERQWAAENPGKIKNATGNEEAGAPADDGFGSIGLRSSGMDFGTGGDDPLSDDSLGNDTDGGDPMGEAPPPDAPPDNGGAPPPPA